MLKVNSNTLIEALAVVDRSVGAETVAISASGQTLTISASINGRSMIRDIAADVDKDIKFSTSAATLMGLCRNRGTVTIRSKSGDITVKSGNYSATVAVVPHEVINIDEPDGNEIDLDSSEMEVIAKLCSDVQLSDVFEDGAPQLPVHIRTTSKGTRVACLDATHVACLHTKQVTTSKQTDIVLPSGVLSQINSSAGGIPYRIILTEASIYAHGETDESRFTYITPLEQSNAGGMGIDNALSMEQVVKGLADSEITAVTLSAEELDYTMSNVLSVTEASSALTLVADKKAKTLTVQTNSDLGSVSNAISATITGKTTDANFSITLLTDILSKIKGDEVTLNITERMMFISQTNGQNRTLYVVSRS